MQPSIVIYLMWMFNFMSAPLGWAELGSSGLGSWLGSGLGLGWTRVPGNEACFLGTSHEEMQRWFTDRLMGTG